MERSVHCVVNGKPRVHSTLARRMARCVVVVVGWSLFAVASGCAGGATQDGMAGALNVAPTDLTTGPDGSLFVSSVSAGKVRRQVDGMWRDVPGPWARPYGLTTASDGRVCLSHHSSEDPLTRQSAVSCHGGEGWTREAVGLGSGVNGLLATAEGIWAIGWQDTDIEQRDGRLDLIADGRVTRRIDVPAYVPRFAVETPAGDLLVSAWREDASGFTGGAILRVTHDGDFDVFADALERPAGLAYTDDGVWVADTAAGALVLLSHDGRERARQGGLEEPTGVTLVEADRICLAETAANRITCLVPANVLGGSP